MKAYDAYGNRSILAAAYDDIGGHTSIRLSVCSTA